MNDGLSKFLFHGLVYAFVGAILIASTLSYWKSGGTKYSAEELVRSAVPSYTLNLPDDNSDIPSFAQANRRSSVQAVGITPTSTSALSISQKEERCSPTDDCCLTSVATMNASLGEVTENGLCESGAQLKYLRCPTSVQWCTRYE